MTKANISTEHTQFPHLARRYRPFAMSDAEKPVQ